MKMKKYPDIKKKKKLIMNKELKIIIKNLQFFFQKKVSRMIVINIVQAKPNP